jgi:hypothetical protein
MRIKLSQSDWQRIGEQMGWMKAAQSTYGDSYWAERDGSPYHPEYGDSAGKKIMLTSGPNNLGTTVSAEGILHRDVKELLSKGQKWVLEKNVIRGKHILYTGIGNSMHSEFMTEEEAQARIKEIEGK